MNGNQTTSTLVICLLIVIFREEIKYTISYPFKKLAQRRRRKRLENMNGYQKLTERIIELEPRAPYN